jgi:ankyrin repeat protein
MIMRSLSNCRHWRSRILFALALGSLTGAWSTTAFAGEIHTAASRGDVEKVKALLSADPGLVSSKDDHGWTPLYGAAASGHKDVVEVLIANKADVDAFNQHFTPLRAAVLNFHKDVADLLIAHNARVTIFDAAAGGYLEIARMLLKDDPGLANFMDDGTTALLFAARNGHKEIAELLLANRADVNATNGIGMTPLQWALAGSASGRRLASQNGTADTNHEAIAELFIANGADVTARNRNGMTALHYAAGNGCAEIIKLLLDHNAEVNAKDSSGRTPLHMAAENGCKGIVAELLARGADVHAKDKDGLSPLDYAAKKEQTEVVELLRPYSNAQ